jgi:uncharacterized protein (TIRG00374 family)
MLGWPDELIPQSGLMRRYGYVIGPLLGLLLPVLAIILIAARTEDIPRVVSVWPLLAVLATAAVTWWLQGLIVAVLARPQLDRLRVGKMFRIYMAGTFVALVSPLRGAEIPYEVYLLRRLGLSAGEASNVVVTRVLLDAAVLTPGALVALSLYSYALPEVQNQGLLLTSLAAAVVLAAVAFLVLGRLRGRAGKRPGGSGWRAKAWVKISSFLSDMRRSFTSYWRPGHRATLLYAVALAIVYWALRLCAGPLALMAVGWSGDWLPVVAAQLLLASFVLPFVPTPGGGGARELGLAALLSGYVPEGQLLSGIMVHTALSHWLPVIAGGFFAGHELRRGISGHSGGRNAAQDAPAEASTRILPAVTDTTSPRCNFLTSAYEPEEKNMTVLRGRSSDRSYPGREQGVREPPMTTRFFNGLGRQVAYFYVRRLMRSDIEWGTDLPSGAKIIAVNHPTTTDPFLMMSWPFEPIYILISEAAFEVPLIGRFLRLAGHVPVYVHRKRDAFEVALRLLGEGQTVGIFPEGALSEGDGRLVSVRSGAVRLAVTAGVPIVPAGIAPDWHFVTARRWRRAGIAEQMRWFWLGAYEVSVGEPLIFEHAVDDREAVRQSTDILTGEIERLMQRSAKRLLDATWPLITRKLEG